MSTYQRSNLQFPAGADSLLKLVDPSTGSPVDLLNNNLNALVVAFAGGTNTDASFSLGDGTSLNIHGSWVLDVSGNPLTVSGYVDSAVRVVTGTSDVLETVDHFSANFSGSYNINTQQIGGDFSEFAALYGANDHVLGGSLGDLLKGFDGNDTIIGHGGNDRLLGGNGNDHLGGGGGRDNMSGGAGADHLDGNGGNDVLLGGGGHDVLNGNAGNDKLNGGGGGDTFVFNNHFGHDTIADFSASNHEVIDFSHVTAITGFADLINHHLHTGAGGFAEIDVGSANSILLHGIHVNQFGSSHVYSDADFIF